MFSSARDELRLCVRRGHPVKDSAKSEHVELYALKSERLILLCPEQRTGQISRYWLNKARIDLTNAIAANNMPAVIRLTELGWGVSFVFEAHHTQQI